MPIQTVVKNCAIKGIVESALERMKRCYLKYRKLTHSNLIRIKLRQRWLAQCLAKTKYVDRVEGFKLKQSMKRIIWLALSSISPYVLAASIGEVAQNTAGSLNAVGSAAQVFFALCGLILIGVSIFTFIKYNKTEGHGVKLSTAFVYLIGGGLLFYVASLIQTTGDTVWGNGGGDRTHIRIQR